MHKGCIGGQDVAIKIVRRSRGAAFTRGIDALMVEPNYVSRLQLGCPHIVRLLGMSHSDVGALCLVYEYANMGCMNCVPEDLDFRGAVGLFAQFAKGLQHMHNMSTVHGDLKPHNMLLHREGEGGAVRGLLADLGMAKLVPIGAQGVQGDRGTRGFVAPECRHTTPSCTFVTFASDVYSFGVTMGCLVTGAKPEEIVAHARAVHPAAPPAAVQAAAAALERRVFHEFKCPLCICMPFGANRIHHVSTKDSGQRTVVRLRPSRYRGRVVTCGTEPYGQRHTHQHLTILASTILT